MEELSAEEVVEIVCGTHTTLGCGAMRSNRVLKLKVDPQEALAVVQRFEFSPPRFSREWREREKVPASCGLIKFFSRKFLNWTGNF